ncbi:MAG: hypothetical protein AB4290_03075, partial [Spirulina sp.]
MVICYWLLVAPLLGGVGGGLLLVVSPNSQLSTVNAQLATEAADRRRRREIVRVGAVLVSSFVFSCGGGV